MLAKVLALRPGELPRLIPYFALYLVLFAALSVADGLSLALFVQGAGSKYLPWAYALAAAVSLAAMGLYLSQVDRRGCRTLFHGILLGFALTMLLAWMGLHRFNQGLGWCALLFVARETAYTLVLMHFGTYLQEHFDRDALNRAFPIVYAGGRVGGIVGGGLLSTLAAPWGMANLALLVALLAIVACVGELLIACLCARDAGGDGGRWRKIACEPGTPPSASMSRPLPAATEREDAACHSFPAFLGLVWHSPLLFWITWGTIAFVGCRWTLNYQYNHVFEQHFASDVAMAQFLGRYTQSALALSLVLQLLVVNRLLAWIGIGGTHLLYALLVLAALGACLLSPGLVTAVLARLAENELRFALRNPAAQWLTNVFSRPLRIRVRAWSLGLLIPLSTLGAAAGLTVLGWFGGPGLVAVVGLPVGLAYVFASWALLRAAVQPLAARVPAPPAAPASQAPSLPASPPLCGSPFALSRGLMMDHHTVRWSLVLVGTVTAILWNIPWRILARVATGRRG